MPLVSRSGVRMERDIVQFVPLRNFKSRSGDNFMLVGVIESGQGQSKLHPPL